jgi:hypothetical protein
MGEKFDISVINDAEEYVGINAQRTWSLCQGELFRLPHQSLLVLATLTNLLSGPLLNCFRYYNIYNTLNKIGLILRAG